MVRNSEEVLDELEHDKAIYKARLKEIEKDKKTGRISNEEAEAAKVEEARKLLTVSKSENTSGTSQSKGQNRLAILSAFAIPLLAFAIYIPLGNPYLPDQSLASRMKASPDDQSAEQLLVRAEAHLAKSPNDTRGWSVVAPIYSRIGREEDAVNAWANVLRLAPDYPNVRSLLGEAILATTDGVMNERAFNLFQTEMKKDPSSARARFYVATGLGQAGEHEQSAKTWHELILGANPKAPWLNMAITNRDEQQIKAGLPKFEAPTINANQSGPTKDQIEAAENMSTADRAEMIQTMVAGLAQKLEDDPSDKSQWKRLIRAYLVLNKKDDALLSIDKAISHHKNDSGFVLELNEIKQNIKN